MRVCQEQGCGREHSARGWCAYHYRIRKEAEGFGRPPCAAESCGKAATTKGLCSAHYNKARIRGDLPGQPLCKIDQCSMGAIFKDGLCSKHHQRQKRYGDPLCLKRKPNGEGSISSDGYVVFQIGSRDQRRQILGHRRAMETHLGRELLPHEEVHHKNGDRSDNRIDNLELWSTSQPKGQRVEDKVAHALYILGLYAPQELAPSPLKASA